MCSYFQFADANPLAQRGKISCPKIHSLRKFHFQSLVKLECHPCVPTSRSLLKVFLGSNCLLLSISRFNQAWLDCHWQAGRGRALVWG